MRRFYSAPDEIHGREDCICLKEGRDRDTGQGNDPGDRDHGIGVPPMEKELRETGKSGIKAIEAAGGGKPANVTPSVSTKVWWVCDHGNE